jgi:hypothetical protein
VSGCPHCSTCSQIIFWPRFEVAIHITLEVSVCFFCSRLQRPAPHIESISVYPPYGLAHQYPTGEAEGSTTSNHPLSRSPMVHMVSKWNFRSTSETHQGELTSRTTTQRLPWFSTKNSLRSRWGEACRNSRWSTIHISPQKR